MILKRGRLAATELITWRGRPAVRKTLLMRPRIPLLSREIDLYLALREYRQLRRAGGIDGIPRIFARPTPNSLVRDFVTRLMEIGRSLHARGITHTDLHTEANVFVRSDGRPALLDFQLSLTLPPRSWLHRLLVRFDLYHVVKNRRHRTGESLEPEDERLFQSTRRLRRIHRLLLKKPMNLLTRRLFPRALGKLPTDTDP